MHMSLVGVLLKPIDLAWSFGEVRKSVSTRAPRVDNSTSRSLTCLRAATPLQAATAYPTHSHAR